MADIYHDVFIKCSLPAVFNALSTPEELSKWWPLRCSGKPEKECVYNFFFTAEYDWYGKVDHIVPNQTFHIKMTKSDQDWDPTTFGFDLEEMGEGVNLKFFHKNWPELNDHFRRSSYCWAILLQGLKKYLEQGIVVPFEKRE